MKGFNGKNYLVVAIFINIAFIESLIGQTLTNSSKNSIQMIRHKNFPPIYPRISYIQLFDLSYDKMAKKVEICNKVEFEYIYIEMVNMVSGEPIQFIINNKNKESNTQSYFIEIPSGIYHITCVFDDGRLYEGTGIIN
jgi:hypothetical protein